MSAIYESEYWLASGADKQPAGLDLSLFDGSVNSGVGQGKKWLAKARAAGPETQAQVHAFAAARLSMLEALKTWRTFGKGWAARVAGVEAKALRMALTDHPAPATVIQAKAVVAQDSSASAKTQATVSGAGAVVVAAGMAAAGAHPALVASAGLVGVLAAAWRAFAAWTQSHRADALSAQAQA